jgi:hypothetical protein
MVWTLESLEGEEKFELTLSEIHARFEFPH